MFYLAKFTGSVFKMRLETKAFKTSQSMHEFLNKQNNNDWQETHCPLTMLPTGKYVKLGGHWTNIKKVDAATLAHC